MMRTTRILILTGLILGLLVGGTAYAEENPPPVPAAPQAARLVVFESFVQPT